MPVETLPPDNYGVRVENDLDRMRLLWLANEIGEERLRTSVRKFHSRFLGATPYISKLLKWHRVAVPSTALRQLKSPP